jgi:hypothetical protein
MGQVKGQNEYNKFKKGGRLTLKGAILAQCYSCNGFGASNEDCLGLKSCPLYPYSPHGGRAGLNPLAKPKVPSGLRIESVKGRFRSVKDK